MNSFFSYWKDGNNIFFTFPQKLFKTSSDIKKTCCFIKFFYCHGVFIAVTSCNRLVIQGTNLHALVGSLACHGHLVEFAAK